MINGCNVATKFDNAFDALSLLKNANNGDFLLEYKKVRNAKGFDEKAICQKISDGVYDFSDKGMFFYSGTPFIAAEIELCSTDNCFVVFQEDYNEDALETYLEENNVLSLIDDQVGETVLLFMPKEIEKRMVGTTEKSFVRSCQKIDLEKVKKIHSSVIAVI